MKEKPVEGLEKMKTGIKGFDEMLNGGIPKNRSVMVVGSTGVGKTVLLNEFIYRGITKFDQPGVIVTMEEKPEDIERNVSGFGWDYEKLQEEGKLKIVDVSPQISQEIREGTDYNLGPLVERIKYAVNDIGAERVAIDSLSALFNRFQEKDPIRTAIYQIIDEMKSMGVTAMLTAEKTGGENTLARYGVEEYVADGAIELTRGKGDEAVLRNMWTRKMRGANFRSDKVNFEITGNGIEVYPKMPMDTSVAKTDYKERKEFGLKKLDDIMGGGIPKGHTVLVGGNTGTGKTTLGIQYLLNGVKNGENGIFISLEEPVPQIKKSAKQMGFDLEKHEKEGRLTFVREPLIDTLPDKLLYHIIDAVHETNATRVVFDSVSSLKSSMMTQEGVRRFLIQLTNFFKTEGITSLVNYLTSSMFQPGKSQLLGSLQSNEMRLSSVIDGIILMRYIERNQRVDKLLNVLKMRGSKHSKDLFSYKLDENGFQLGEKFRTKLEE